MPLSARRQFRPGLALCSAALIGVAPALTTSSRNTSFLSENNAAVAKMMAAMNVEPSGDADADFVAAMIPHHEGAIDMATAELRHGRNEQLRRLAQEIIVSQQQEIVVMRLAAVPSTSVGQGQGRSEEHTSELPSHSDVVCRLLLVTKTTYSRWYTKLNSQVSQP